MTNESTRLNKYLALHMGISRREADELIEKGSVTVNGTVAILGSQASDGDDIAVNGNPLGNQTSLRYVLFNKPVGYVCSRKAQGENPTIYDLLPSEMVALKPVGRLDKDSSGLLVLTNDGDFAHRMTHPSFKKTKVYQVRLDRALEPLHQQMIADYGIEIGDGTSKLSLERVDDDRKDWVVTMSEGRNRQIRRTFGALGYTIESLHRTVFGTYDLSGLASGQTRELAHLD